MRILDRTVSSIGLLTEKTARARPSVKLKRYIRDWFQLKCTTEINCDIRSTPLSFSFAKSNHKHVAHILAGCPTLAQNLYTARHNAGLKCLYFTLLKHYGLVNKIPPWHSAIVPKPELKNDEVRILWDVPTHTGECSHNRVTGRMSQCSTNKHKKSW